MKRYRVRYMTVLYILIVFMTLNLATLVEASSLSEENFEFDPPATQSVSPGDGDVSVPFHGYIFGEDERYSMTYHANGGEGGRVDAGLVPSFPYKILTQGQANIHRSSYRFISWNTASDGTGSAYTGGESVTLSGDVVLYAQWQRNKSSTEEPTKPTITPEPTESEAPTPTPTATPEPTETEPPAPTETTAPQATPEPTEEENSVPISPTAPDDDDDDPEQEEPAVSEIPIVRESLPPLGNPELLVPRDDGSYIEIDENGIPLGVWTIDDAGEWTFEEYPAEKNFPQTGVADTAPWLIFGISLLVLLILLLLYMQYREEKKRRKENGEKRRKARFLYLMICLCLIGVVGCGYSLVWEIGVQEEGRGYYQALSLSSVQNGRIAETVSVADGNALAMPAVDGAKASTMDFDMLRHYCPDITVWLKCEGTNINYPVVQAEDNDYYLGRLPDGTAHKMGSLFLDYRNDPDFSDQNSIIYGHHMNNGDMFGELKYYKTQEYYEQHPIMTLYTPEKTYRVELIAGTLFDPAKETLPLFFTDAESFDQYIADVKGRSLFISDVEVNPDDRLVTLATCSYEFLDARFILTGRLVAVQETI